MANRVYVTGDLHGEIDRDKLSSKRFPDGKTLDKKDYVIILGDFGVLWASEPDKHELNFYKWFNKEKAWTTLFVDGNHENHIRLNNLPLVDMFGSKVGKVTDSIYHLKRGEVYTICKKKFFTSGGAVSIDMDYRVPGKSWWPEEIATDKEFRHGYENLRKHNHKVDYILAHTAPTQLKPHVTIFKLSEDNRGKFNDPTCKFLQMVADNVVFKDFYFGHFHQDKRMGKFHCLYRTVERII